jgi:hypothetical protein
MVCRPEFVGALYLAFWLLLVSLVVLLAQHSPLLNGFSFLK